MLKNRKVAKIPFGLKNGIMVDVEEVDSGVACGCVCPVCLTSLEARKGSIRTHYFAHSKSVIPVNCVSAFESSIHLMAKQILCEEKWLKLPKFSIYESAKDLNEKAHTEIEKVFPETQIRFEDVVSEQPLGNVIPDLIGSLNGKRMAIEIGVTHFCDERKRKKLEVLDISCIEINLRGIDHRIDKAKLRALILNEVENKTWVNFKQQESTRLLLREKLARKIDKINSDIRSSRRAAKGKRKTNFNHFTPYVPVQVIPHRLPENNCFLCEHCRYYWQEKRKYELSYKKVCPACNKEVSLDTIHDVWKYKKH